MSTKKSGVALYEQYKGHFARIANLEGIVCGHCEDQLIIAITKRHKGAEGGWRYCSRDESDAIYTNQNHEEGYTYVPEKRIIKNAF